MAALENQCGSGQAEVHEDAKPKAQAKPKAKGKAKAKQQAKSKAKAKAKAKTKAKAKAGGSRKRTRPAAASKQADENEGGEEEPVEEDAEMDHEEEEEEDEEAEEMPVMKRPSMKAPDKVTRERKPALPQPEIDAELLPKKAAPAVVPEQPEFAIPAIPEKRIRKAETIEDSQISGWFLGLSGLICFVEFVYVSLVVLFHARFLIYVYISSAVRSCGTLQLGLAVAESQHGTQKPVIEDSASQASTLMWFGGLVICVQFSTFSVGGKISTN